MAAGSEDEWRAEEQEEDLEEDEERPRRRFSFATVGKTLGTLANHVGESLVRTAAAAGELLQDAELRSRSAALLTESAKKAGAGVARGLQQGAGRVAAAPRTVQGVLQKIQHRIEEQRLQALLQEQKDTPVDVQVAFQVYEDAPQELRSRLWMALLEHPELVAEYHRLAADLQQQRQQQLPAAAGPAQEAPATAAGDGSPLDGMPSEREQQQQQHEQGGVEDAAGAASSPRTGAEPSAAGAEPAGGPGSLVGGDDDVVEQPSPGSDPAHLSSSYSARWAARHHSPGRSSRSPGRSPSPRPGHVSLRSPQDAAEGDEEGWQMVSDQAAAWKLQGGAVLAGAAAHLAYSREREAFRNILMVAMMSIPWPLPSDYPPDCRYATLLQISVGEEDVEETITRDLHRTFPEYPLFAFEQGQQALFNLLKAYALHDMEASYCQGMAFVAGLLLFYVPEEPAFQIFCRLLSTSGPNLRRLYLPGLEGLKSELRKLEFLLERYLPNLTAHLNATGVVPVLYASQWLLTCYSCPFPVSFGCRLIDIMLQENSDVILLKVAVAILAEIEGDLLMQEDFETLLTCIKTLHWPQQRLRRVLSAAVSSPICPQDLADAEAALQQGFTGSLSRVPTFSAESEAAMPGEGEGQVAGDAAAAGAASAGAGSAEAAAAGAAASAGSGAGPSVVPAEDTVAADLAAAQQQIDDELTDLLQLMLDFSGDDDTERTYSASLQKAVEGDPA